MKKIVGIIAAVAMAASVFAVDITAGVRMEGNIFSYDGNAKQIEMLSLTNNNENYHKPFVMSISGDRAGATVKINEKMTDTMKITNMNIWFKPFDMVKIEFGNVSEAMNTETMGWWRRTLNYDMWGFKASVNVDAFTASAALLTGDVNPWFVKADGVDAVMKDAVLYAKYDAAEIGAFSTMLYLVACKDVKIAAGYKNSIAGVNFFVDYLYDGVAKNNVIDADVKYSYDALTAEAYTKVTLADKTAMMLVSRVSYALNGLNTYVEFQCNDLLADSFGCTIIGDLSGSVGAMGWEVQATYDTLGKKFTVPFNVAVSF